MDRIERLTQLNAELEGLLHVLERRDTDNIRTLIKSKYADFVSEFAALMDDFDQNPVIVAGLGQQETVEQELAHDEVKNQEAVSNEVEDEMDAASQAIEHGMEKEECSCTECTGTDAVKTTFDDVVPVTLGELVNEDTPVATVSQEYNTTEVHDTSQPEAPVAKQPEDSERRDAEIRVDEMLSRKGAADLKRVFTLNDKFRFRRALFNQDDAAFAEALDNLADLDTFAQARQYVAEQLGWNLADTDVDDFMSIIKPHYNN